MARNFINASSEKASTSTVPVTALPFSFACWFRCSSTPASSYGWPLLGLHGATADIWIQAYYSSIFGRRLQVMYNTNYRGEGDADWSENTWHHAVLTVADADNRVLRLDGSAYNNSAGGVAINSSGTFDVGYSPNGGSGYQYHNGDIAEVSVWNVSLTDAETTILSKGFVAPFVRPDSLVFYAPMWGYHDPEAELIAGNTLTLTNTPAYANNPPLRRLRRLGRFDDSASGLLLGSDLVYSGGTLL